VWESEKDIRKRYSELAPLLPVATGEPTEDTLREVKGLVDGLEEPVEKRDNLSGLSNIITINVIVQFIQFRATQV